MWVVEVKCDWLVVKNVFFVGFCNVMELNKIKNKQTNLVLW